MKLIDVLSMVKDNTYVLVTDGDGFVIAKHDGKDGIPDELNDKEVIDISIEGCENDYGGITPYLTIAIKEENNG